ncbi:uncharacterized protein LOC111613402 [Centruroides sculpturatus]|uniref:uncharacterized protein LOC111613402 n=1 Tax=Centruroides sculpturatus TaxID=218467 RepID=UPI000C6E6591|nr:uncharacterized protein LOC111613402 [Centruroides sculpturatus]
MEFNKKRSEFLMKSLKAYGETTKVAIVAPPGLDRLLTIDSEDQYFVSEDILFTRNLAFAMRKGFPYKSKIDKLMRRLIEHGIFYRLSGSNLFKPKPTPHNDSKPLSVEDLFGAFLLLFAGYTLSFFCFLAEIFVGKIWNRKCLLQK